jgi:hypothetical protein
MMFQTRPLLFDKRRLLLHELPLRRHAWYVGKTWFAERSDGNGRGILIAVGTVARYAGPSHRSNRRCFVLDPAVAVGNASCAAGKN